MMSADDLSPRFPNAPHGDAECTDNPSGRKPISAAATRALAEAEQRRLKGTDGRELPREVGGRGGLDPSRYQDWEINGRAVDF